MIDIEVVLFDYTSVGFFLWPITRKIFYDVKSPATPTIPRLAKFSCEEPGCPATFCDQKGFFDHFLYHFTKRTCVCVVEGCNQNFSNLITLSKHTKLHFGELIT